MEKHNSDIKEGILEITDRGHGFLRDIAKNFNPLKSDPYVPLHLIRQYRLREGLLIKGEVKKPPRSGQNYPLVNILEINEMPADEYADIKDIRSGISIDPEEQMIIKQRPDDVTGHIIDMLIPIGKGQRGMIILPISSVVYPVRRCSIPRQTRAWKVIFPIH